MKSIWQRLTEKGKLGVPHRTPVAQPLAITEFGSHELCSIEEIGFIGHFSRSPSGRFRLIWSDRDPGGRIGGARTSGHGRWSLLDEDRLVIEGRLERPSHGQVADDGTFIIADVLFGDALACKIQAYRADGSRIFSRDIAANLVGCAIAGDGRHAIYQTANAPGSPDSCRYFLFDLAGGDEIANWEPETGWASDYAFDRAADLVYLIDGEGIRVAYRFDGQMDDRPGWEERRLDRGDLSVIRAIFEREKDAIDDSMRFGLLAGCDVAVARGDVHELGRALRLRGEILEQGGDLAGALAAYDEALTRDPQIGVTRRADALRRKLEPSASKLSPKKKLSKLERQAERLGIAHEVVGLEHGMENSWRCPPDGSFAQVELAALDHYRAQGWNGAAAEGGLILTLLKAASFTRLAERHADTFVEALYAQNVAFEEDRFNPATLISDVARSDIARIEANWKVISAAAQTTPRFYPRVERDHVLGLFEALGPQRLAAIADIFATAPYDLRSGWPDLTLWCGRNIRFVEVKAPSDSLQAKQVRLVSRVLLPLGFETALAEVQPI